MKTWFSIKAKADNTVEVSIFDEIGAWGVTAKDFINELKKHPGKSVSCLINSPGGSVFDALAIYNAMRSHGSEIVTKTMGVAASAASVIFMAGDKRVMPENTFLMIHNPLTFAYGNAEELRDMAEVLDKIAASLIGTYCTRSGMDEAEVKALLDAETWLNAAESVEKGFATETEAEMKIAAAFEIDRLPENIRAVFEAATTTITETETETTTSEKTTVIESDDPNIDPLQAAEATVTEKINGVISAAGFAEVAGVFLLDEKIQTVEDVTAAVAVAREIRALCDASGKPDEAVKLIKQRATLADARKHLTDILADADEETYVDGTPPSKNSKPAKNAQPAALKPADVWAARRKQLH